VELDASNLVDRLIVASASLRMTNCPWKRHGQVTWKIKILVGTNHITGTAEARVVKFCTHKGYIKSKQKDDKRPLKGVQSGSCGPFYILGPPMISLEWQTLES